eukprot:jgi/Mesvir1/18550/Mv25665-RA.1
MAAQCLMTKTFQVCLRVTPKKFMYRLFTNLLRDKHRYKAAQHGIFLMIRTEGPAVAASGPACCLPAAKLGLVSCRSPRTPAGRVRTAALPPGKDVRDGPAASGHSDTMSGFGPLAETPRFSPNACSCQSNVLPVSAR